MNILEKEFQNINLYFEAILKKQKYKKIILFDFDNKHGQIMYNLIKKNPFHEELNKIEIQWEKINSFSQLTERLLFHINEQYAIFSIPMVWNENIEDINKILEIISLNNIIVCAYDENFSFPWCLDFVFKADKQLHWATQLNNYDYATTGTSVMCIFLSIVALAGKEELNKMLTYIHTDN